MDRDLEDIKKLDAIIKEENDHNNFRDEFDDFINHTISDDEEQLGAVDETELTEIEDAIDNIVDAPDQSIYHNVENLNFSTDLNAVKHFLDLEEMKVISACKDAKLKKLLILNRAKHVKLQNLRYKLYELLKECKVSIRKVEDDIENFNSNDTFMKKGILSKLGHPYYKTKDFYSCSPNADTVKKQQNNEICIYYLPQLSRWTIEDQIILKRAIIFHYTTASINKYETQLKSLRSEQKRATDPKDVAKFEKNILELQKKLSDLKQNQDPDPPSLNESNEIDWITISRTDLDNRHYPEACKAFWNIYLHPSINKVNWSDTENKQIQELGKKYNFQNWEQIASDLQNNRSGFAVCVHYYSTLSDKYKKDRFDLDEDQYLIEVVDACRIGNYIPWSKVSYYFKNRSRGQLYHRYKYNLEYSNMIKGTFSEAEDVLIALLVEKYGKDFTRCAKLIPNRSPTQIGHRYNNYLSYDKMDLGFWPLEADKTIMDHVEMDGAKNWSKLITTLPTKNRTHLRQRYMHIKKWLLKNPNRTIADMPRRTKRRRGMSSDIFEMIKKCVEHFSAFPEIPTMDEINEQLQVMGQTPRIVRPIIHRAKNDNIDKELIEYFQGTCRIKTSKTVSKQELTHIGDIMKILLATLDVQLVIPEEDSLRSNPRLDLLDIEILSHLAEDSCKKNMTFKINCSTAEPTPSSSKITNFVLVSSPRLENCETRVINFNQSNTLTSYLPPNINTLVGMRGLLLLYQRYKSKRAANKQVSKIIGSKPIPAQPEVSYIDDQTQIAIVNHQEKYFKRFNTIFKWPAIMSVMKPNENLLVNKSAKKIPSKPKEPLKVGRPKKNLIKIELMNKARLNKTLPSQQPSKINLPQPNSTEVCPKIDISETTITLSPSQPSTSAAASGGHQSSANLAKVNVTFKRDADPSVDKCKLKKIKIEKADCKMDLGQLRDDINKLDSVLKLELNRKC